MQFKKNDIVLRLIKESDITERYLSWFSDKAVIQFLEVNNLKKEEVLDYIKLGIKNKTYFMFAVCIADNGLHIGNIKIGPIKHKYFVTDLVTVIGDKNYWGKGVASIAIRKAIKLGFDKGKIRKFVASINSLNIGSVNAYIKAGFKKEATIYNYFYNKIDNKVLLSDKIFVSCENKKYDMQYLKNWKPFT